MVDAMGLWRKIAAWPDSVEAVQFYDAVAVRRYPAKMENFSDKRKSFKEEILLQGKADFDELVTKHSDDDPRYRIAYYASRSGSMDMHIRQNLVVFRKYLKDIRENKKSILCVDYGCGPMTSGLALADVLSRSCKMDDYKRHVTYHGIDASARVVEFAKDVNDKCKVFAPRRFSVVQADDLCLNNIPACSPRLAILCLSFVLAPGTFKMGKRAAGQKDAEELAEQWDKFVQRLPGCEETLIMYINPRPGRLKAHRNWHPFRSSMKKLSNRGQNVKYCVGDLDEFKWRRDRLPYHGAMITGRRQ